MKPSDSSASPVAPMSRSTCRPSASVGASGFSHSTALPARAAATTCAACTESCDAITTASTAGSTISANASSWPSPPGGGLGAREVDVRDRGHLGATDGPAQRLRVVGAHGPGADHPFWSALIGPRRATALGLGGQLRPERLGPVVLRGPATPARPGSRAPARRSAGPGRGWWGTRSPPRPAAIDVAQSRCRRPQPCARAARDRRPRHISTRSTVSIARPNADETWSRFAMRRTSAETLVPAPWNRAGLKNAASPFMQRQLDVVLRRSSRRNSGRWKAR